jgi:gamma-glutamyltranspeptidase/glutathione hydrolase
LAKAVKAAGGALAASEVEAYKVIERVPLKTRWEGYDVFTMPPPSAGGLMLVQALGMFNKVELERLGHASGAYQHLIAESLRASIADRMRYLGDPDHQKIDLKRLLSAKRLAKRRKSIALDRTHAIPRFGLEEHGTHHLVTADALGNFVSLTTTVNRAFGAKIMDPDTGILLNDELDDFTAKADVKPFGMTQSPNRPRPGARPVSSMTPTLVVRDGRVVLAVGGSGGTAIATNVTQIVLSHLVFNHDARDLLKRPRFYIPTEKAFILLEDAAPKSLWEDLEARGEIVGKMPFTSTAVQLIAVKNGYKFPAADPRKHGTALTR